MRLTPIVKKVLMVAAVKKGVDAYRDLRRPQKRSLASRLRPAAVVTAAGGAAVYGLKGGRMRRLMDKIRGKTESNDARANGVSGDGIATDEVTLIPSDETFDTPAE